MMNSLQSVARFLASDMGRWIRVAAGAGLMVSGIRRGGAGGAVAAAVGLVPLAAGALDYCLISYLFGGPLRGEDIRRG
jgi:uncharacterized membrane protein